MHLAIEEISLSAQTAYAQLFEAALVSQHLRSVADLPGTFVHKTVKGHKYWYYQYSEPGGKVRQAFVGPENAAVQALMEKKRQPSADEGVIPLAKAAAALGCALTAGRHYKVLRRLAEYGFFNAGGVLIGTHAFVAYGNMLGVKWGSADVMQMHDIDFAHAGKNITLALVRDAEVQTGEAIRSLEMGFLPIAGLGGKTGGAYLNPKEPEFRLDFLTTAGMDGEQPYEHPDLHVTLQPLKFMEFSLENVQQTVVLSNRGATVVNVPHPARYALHKLLVAGEREGAFRAKVDKDLMQAGLLLSIFRETREWEVENAWKDLASRGSGWIARTDAGLENMAARFPQFDFRDWLRGIDCGRHMPADKQQPVPVFYGKLYADPENVTFLESLGVRVGRYDQRERCFHARLSSAAMEQIKHYPADFRVDAFLRTSSDKAPPSDDDLRAEAAYFRFLIHGGAGNGVFDPSWETRLTETQAEMMKRSPLSEAEIDPESPATAPK